MSQPRGVIRWIVQSSLNLRFLVVAASVVLMVLGFTSLSQMRVDVFPEFAPPRVVIQTACVGLSTSDVEELVTVPLEQGLNGLQGLDDMRSKSVPQLSSIELLFSPDTDLLRARQLVQERLAIVSPTLPTWAAPPVMLAPVSATGRAMQIGMTSKKNSLIEMSMSAYWNIRTRLLQVPGVANVAIWNERLQLMTVQVEPARMAGKKVSLDQVMETTADAVDSGLLRFSSGSVIGPAGWSRRRTSDCPCATSCRSSRRQTWPRCPSRAPDRSRGAAPPLARRTLPPVPPPVPGRVLRGAGAAPAVRRRWATWPRSWRPTSPSSGTRSSTR